MGLKRRSPLQATAFVAEWTSVNALMGRTAAWQRLLQTAADPNPFYSPSYLSASAELEATDIRCVAIWRSGAHDAELIGLFPLMRGRVSDGALLPAAEFYRNDYVCLTTPLVDAHCAEAVWESFIDCCAATPGHPQTLLSRISPMTSATFRALENVLARRGLAHRTFGAFERAILTKPDRFQTAFAQIPARRRKDMQRRRRRLREDGHGEINVLRGDQITPDALNAFLDLEASGWKGRAGTAMKLSPATRLFATRVFAARDAELSVLTFNGQPIAVDAGIIAGGTIHTVKTAYDEAFSTYAPGLLLGVHTMRRLSDDPNLRAADSCAVEGHVFGDIWPERMALGNLIIGTAPHIGEQRLDHYVTLLQSFASMKSWIKSIMRP